VLQLQALQLEVVGGQRESYICGSSMHQRRLFPELVVALASAAWGFFWIPLRAIEHHGLDPAWATLTQFVAPLAIMTPFTVARLARRHPTGVRQHLTGVLVGAAALYTLRVCSSLT
jgi:hypothetical protein